MIYKNESHEACARLLTSWGVHRVTSLKQLHVEQITQNAKFSKAGDSHISVLYTQLQGWKGS